MAAVQSTVHWGDGRCMCGVCVCVWGGGGGRMAVMQSTLRWEDGRSVCVWGGGVEQQSCSQHCDGRMGAVCVGGGGEVSNATRNTNHIN